MTNLERGPYPGLPELDIESALALINERAQDPQVKEELAEAGLTLPDDSNRAGQDLWQPKDLDDFIKQQNNFYLYFAGHLSGTAESLVAFTYGQVPAVKRFNILFKNDFAQEMEEKSKVALGLVKDAKGSEISRDYYNSERNAYLLFTLLATKDEVRDETGRIDPKIFTR